MDNLYSVIAIPSSTLNLSSIAEGGATAGQQTNTPASAAQPDRLISGCGTDGAKAAHSSSTQVWIDAEVEPALGAEYDSELKFSPNHNFTPIKSR